MDEVQSAFLIEKLKGLQNINKKNQNCQHL